MTYVLIISAVVMAFALGGIAAFAANESKTRSDERYQRWYRTTASYRFGNHRSREYQAREGA